MLLFIFFHITGLIKVDLEFSFSIPGLFQTWNSNTSGFEKLNPGLNLDLKSLIPGLNLDLKTLIPGVHPLILSDFMGEGEMGRKTFQRIGH